MSRESHLRALDPFLLTVATPGQYLGGEWNTVAKAPRPGLLRVALGFPDAYAVGMSHHGLRVLYELLNALPDVAAERVFAPLPDMEQALRARGLPLTTLETMTPLAECDLVGFSLQYELCSANVLTMLDLGGVPLHASARGPGDPLVLAGGAGAFNPEPLAGFLDLVLVGEAEEAFPELVARLRDLDRARLSREALLRELVRTCPGWYAPSLYTVEQGRAVPRYEDVPAQVERRVVRDLEAAAHPRAPVVPVVQTAHERVTVEIMRGCPHACRFCQAGAVSRPRRARSVDTIVDIAEDCYRATGYDEVGLLSLSTSDHPQFGELVGRLDEVFAPRGVSLSLPSLRVDAALSAIPERVRSVRKGGFTLAPEAATERLRRVINKPVDDDDLLAGAQAAFRAGWRTIKLYFMVGLPTETDDDVDAIPRLAKRVAALGGRGKRSSVHLSVANFVPKAWTPFQWAAMDRPEVLAAKQARVAEGLGRGRSRVRYRGHDVQASILEAALARAGRDWGPVVEAAWRHGARLCAWEEHFRPQAWQAAFASQGVDPEAVACRERTVDAPLPWAHLSGGLSEDRLRADWQRAREGAASVERETPSRADRV